MKRTALKQEAKLMTKKKSPTPASKPQHGAAGKTGTWRTFKPVLDRESCKECGNCSMYCPESCIDKDLNIDYDYCKGCGICANECPSKSIKMVRE